MLHKMLLKEDGWLDENTVPVPGGAREHYLHSFNANEDTDYFTIRNDDIVEDLSLIDAWHQHALYADQNLTAQKWERLWKSLVMHFDYQDKRQKRNS